MWVSVRVLQELIAERQIVDGVARTKNGHADVRIDKYCAYRL